MDIKMFQPHVIRRYPRKMSSMLALLVVLVGCSKASDSVAPYTTPAGWSTICLDRFLIDSPSTVEMGAAEAESKSVYGFDGIEDIGGGALRWGKVPVLETVPTDAEGYRSVYSGALAKVATPADYKSGFKRREKEIEGWIQETKSGTREEIASAQEFVDDGKKRLKASHYSFKVSGEATLSEKHAFAIRHGSDFTIGYLDSVDHRVRKFEGKLTHPELESPEAAAEEYKRFRRIYHARLPSAFRATPGYCTSFGFIVEPDGPETDIELKLPFRIEKYPNLIFTLTLEPADPGSARNIQKLPNMDARNAKLDLIGVKGSYGPVKETILGTPGRSFGQEYGPNCSATSCRPPDQAYDIEAETFGVPGRVDQPHLILHMTAATSDDYKLKRPFIPNEPSYNKPDRPALSGHVPPPFKEGQKIFEQVLRSIRLRPGAITAPSATAPAVAAAATAQDHKK
ncbi:MAG: hypothetical protein H7173_10640 [Rhodoferax sp.]|nr:hypothetical protein [Pseudorhodobacter sp.]